MTTVLLEVLGVTKRYRRGGLLGRRDDVTAVDRVSLRLEAGRILAVAGASGSGKSTLGRIILGLERPDEGEVLFRGQSLGTMARNDRRAVQAVFQNSLGAVNPRFTARDIVGEPLRNFFHLRGMELTRRVGDLMHEVGLEPNAMDKYPHQWSGGELQRLCIARALGPSPDLLVLDEAVGSLDMLNQARITSLLQDIRRDRGTAFLFISHDMRLVASLADSLAVMKDGRVGYYTEDISAPGVGTGDPGLYRELLLAVPAPDVDMNESKKETAQESAS